MREELAIICGLVLWSQGVSKAVILAICQDIISGDYDAIQLLTKHLP